MHYRESPYPLPIVAISGGGRIPKSDLLDSAGLLGATEVIEKPFEMQELLDAVERVLIRPDDPTPVKQRVWRDPRDVTRWTVEAEPIEGRKDHVLHFRRHDRGGSVVVAPALGNSLHTLSNAELAKLLDQALGEEAEE